MSVKIQDSRMIVKRSSNYGDVPTVAPSADHTDGTWSVLDLYSGELFLEEQKGKLFIRTSGTIEQILTNKATTNEQTGADATVGGGTNNLAAGDHSHIGGGQFNETKSLFDFTQADGRYAYADRWASKVYGNDRYTVKGGSQEGRQIVSDTTTNNTPLVLTADGTSGFSIPIQTSVLFRAEVIAIQTGGASGTAGDTASWIIKGTIKNVGGTTAIVGAVSYETGTALTGVSTQRDGDAAASAWTVSAAANNGNDRLELTVTGETNKTIKWVGSIFFTEVRY